MNLDAIKTRIGIPPHTKLAAIFRIVREGELQGEWHVWLAVRDMQQPYSKWQGTYLALDDKGGVTRITVYDDGHEDVMVVK